MLSPLLDESEKDLERHRGLTAARVVEENTGQGAAPTYEQGHQLPLRKMRTNHRLREVGNANAVERGAQQQLEIIDGQRALGGDLGMLAALVEYPGLDRAVPGHAESDAVVGMEISGKKWFRMARDIARSRDGKHPEIIQQAQNGHVAFHPMTDTNAGIKSAADNVAMCVIDGYFDADLGVFGQKRLDERREHARGGWA